jgi:hypothetical protein
MNRSGNNTQTSIKKIISETTVVATRIPKEKTNNTTQFKDYKYNLK